MIVVLEIPRNISGEDSEVSKQIRRKGNEGGRANTLSKRQQHKKKQTLGSVLNPTRVT